MKHLAVLIHGWLLNAKQLEPLRDLLHAEEQLRDSDIFLYPYPASRFSNARLEAVSLDLCNQIEGRTKKINYDTISFVGHSIGGLIARRAFLLASPYHNQSSPYSWSARVTKIVLIGTPNRGSSFVEEHWWAPYAIYILVFLRQSHLIRDALRGSPFITNLRLDWVRAFRAREDQGQLLVDHGDSDALAKLPPIPEIVQLVCEKDEKVLEVDSLDVTQFGNAHRELIKNETHESVIKFTRLNNHKHTKIRNFFLTIKDALVNNPFEREHLKYCKIRNAILTDTKKQKRRMYLENVKLNITNTTFLIHGIRTRGDWTERASEIIQGKDAHIEVLKPKYGYFQILKFLWGPTRQARVEWFRDRYVQAFVEYPKSSFNYVGHSNGTYILANTLKQFQSIVFDRVYFAGSVVPQSFEWPEYFDSGQLQYLRSDRASRDVPVGFLCAGLHKLGIKNLGAGGYTGFREKPSKFYENVLKVKGSQFDGHSIALNPENYKTIRTFLTGNPEEGKKPPSNLTGSTVPSSRKDKIMNHLHENAGVYFIFLVMIVFGIGAMALFGGGPLWFLMYVGALYFILWLY